MTSLTEKLRLKGQAEEDVYFARRDRELIEALERRKRARQPRQDAGQARKQGDGSDDDARP